LIDGWMIELGGGFFYGKMIDFGISDIGRN
jgi:hypothetical protein